MGKRPQNVKKLRSEVGTTNGCRRGAGGEGGRDKCVKRRARGVEQTDAVNILKKKSYLKTVSQ